MYSALKVNGKKLYELAREGKVVERKARPVKILDIRIIEMDLPRVRMEVSCSKGTYIRTLCHDIGEQLGCGGCMESLIRTRVSAFQIKDAKTLEEIGALKQEGMLEEILVPIDEMFPLYPKITVKDDWKAFAKNGNPLDEKMLKDADAKLNIIWKNKKVVLSAQLRQDYSQDEEFNTAQVDFTIEKNYRPVNHIICLGQGDLKNRAVIHLFCDENGGIQPYATKDIPLQDSDYILGTSRKVMDGEDEVVEILDYPNAEITENYI